MELFSRVKKVLIEWKAKPSSATPAAISDDTTLEQFLEHTKASKDQVQGMLTQNADDSRSRLRVNGSQCEYLAEKLKLAVHEAVLRYSEQSSVSQGEKTHRLNDIKLLHSVACAAENFIQNCCTDAWVVAAFLMPNVSQDVLSISFDLAVLAKFFSGNFTMEVESVYRAEASVVAERAASDRRLLLRNLMALLRTREDKTSKEYVLAELLVKRLESGEVYCTEIATLKEEDLLGEGGFAAVYKSKWLEIDVAAKTFKAVRTSLGPSPPPDFQEEVSLLKRLSHPNVASMYCYAEGERECSIVMELMDRDLFKLIRNIMKDKSKKHPFSMFAAVDIMLQVGKGVEYLHEMKIVHRDLKAANILVKQLGNRGDGESKSYILAKVADVGISKAKENSITSSAQTLNTGTTRWMAPELIRPTGKLEVVSEDPNVKKYYPYRCDSYGFGMVCYEILAGREPYDDLIRKPSQVKKKILRGIRPELPEHCLPELKDLIRRCWSQEPSERPRLDEICATLRKIRFHLLFSGAGSTAYFSRITSMFEPKAESSSATSSAIQDVIMREPFLERARDCNIRAHRKLVLYDAEPVSPLRVNDYLCEYLAEKLKLVVQEAEMFLTHLQGSPISQGERTNCFNAFKLLHHVACAVENFIQICCKDAWVAAALLMPNMSRDVLSISFDLAVLANFFSGNFMMGVENMYRAQASVVTEKAAIDSRLLVSNVKALLRTEQKTSAEYQLAKLLLTRLETPEAYRTDIESLTEKKLIVEGTSANLYKSKWLGMDVALKTFKAVKTDHEPSSPLEFQAEVSIVGGLSHPNLVSVFGYAEDKWECSIVMELMDCDLSEFMRQIMEDRSKEHPFSIIEAVNIMLEVGKGVEYLHEMKIVHRGLKAANILVKKLGKWQDGESMSILVKVGDFGLSKTKEKSMTYSMQTASMGSARWMAPEVIQMRRNEGQEEVSSDTKVLKYPRQTDVFSFGMVCYEIITGRQPYFEEESQNEVKKMILRGDRPVLPEHCLAKLKDLIERCWSHDASKRPCFREICEELRSFRYQLLSSSIPLRLMRFSKLLAEMFHNVEV